MESFSSKSQESLLGFLCNGGIFGEGIDLKHDRLIGAVIVGTGLPQICNEREILRNYYDHRGGNGFAYAYLYPGMNKVLQSAGRVIRTDRDRGVILLLDDRFAGRQYIELFPENGRTIRCVTAKMWLTCLLNFGKGKRAAKMSGPFSCKKHRRVLKYDGTATGDKTGEMNTAQSMEESMRGVRRVYVEKKPAFAVQAKELGHEIRSYLGIRSLTGVRVLIRYDVENISDEVFQDACKTVFSEPPVDTLYEETFETAPNARVFSVEYLPGQFDQRADSAVQCVKFLNEDEEPIIRSATTYVIEGEVSDEEFEAIKNHCINPVDSRETDMVKPETLVTQFDEPADVITIEGFIGMPQDQLKEFYASLNLAMTFMDFLHIQNYFREEEKRDPSMTEIRVLDTYWSDHCRHTTFPQSSKK